MPPAWVQTTVGAVLAFGFGAADAFYFHGFSKDMDLVMILAGLGALGIHTAYQVGKATPS